MKKLTMKNVALGLALAGYAASSAFAIDVQTSATIIGNAPIFGKKTASTAPTDAADMVANASLVKGKDNTATEAEVGDTIVLEFQVFDEDGDLDSITKGSSKNIIFKITKDGKTWTDLAPTRATLGKAELDLTAAHLGAKSFGYFVTAETQYGAPDKGNWVLVSDLASLDAPSTGGGDETPPPGGGGGGNGGTINPPNEGLGGGLPSHGIFRVGSYKAADNYTLASSGLVPKLGDQFELVVWVEKPSGIVGEVDANEVANILVVGTEPGQLTGVNWGFEGDDSLAHGDTASVTHTNLTGATDMTYTLPATNAGAVGAIGKAGVQGYKLSVQYTVNP